MAKLLRKLAPGYSDTMPAPDWCEMIMFEARQNAESEQGEIYGAACGRWCVPGGTAGFVPKSDSDYGGKRAKELIWDVWSAGSSGWGSCCCMGGPPSDAGVYHRECHKALRGDTYCYVNAFAGCCKPSSHDQYCNACLRSALTCCTMFVAGGVAGPSRCWHGYCCGDTTTMSSVGNNLSACINEGPGNVPFKTTIMTHCSCQALTGYTHPQTRTCAHASGMEVGRQPFNVSEKYCGGKNCVPIGKAEPMPGGGMTISCASEFGDGGVFNASGTCQLRYKTDARKFGSSFITNNCYNGCAVWLCGMHFWNRFQYNDPTHVTSGSAYINMATRNAVASGGWNWTNYMHCALGGQGTNNCTPNLRMIGGGGVPARVCAGACCCSGPGMMGAIIVKYR